MVKDEECNNPIGAKALQAWSMGKPCDACRIKSSLLYCKADSAYLCVDCDVKVHGANKLASRHERLWMCDVCEQAPAAVTCKADAAVLCLACDDDIHSANPLARRHERLPVASFFECARLLKPSLNYSHGGGGGGNCFGSEGLEDDDLYAAEAVSWLLPNPKQGGGGGGVDGVKSSATAAAAVAGGDEGNNKTGGCFLPSGGMDFFPDVDPYLDMEYASSMEAAARVSGSTDSVVPQSHGSGGGSVLDGSSASDGFDADPPCKGGYSYSSATSLSHSISSSSLDVGVVPDATLNDISTPYGRSGMFELAGHGAVHVGMHYTVPMDREAKVMRYKEKRKNRKFEKTIRYASRKAYAETRPRIKGRFAKRTDVDVEQMYTSADLGCGLVPTF